MPKGPSHDLRPLATREALADANTVALVIHGVGDHTSVDLLSETERGAAALWGDKATTTRLRIEGVPVPEDVNRPASVQQATPEALQILVDSRKHIVFPVIWSGVRRRSKPLAARGGFSPEGLGAAGIAVAVPTLFNILLNLLRCIPRAKGSWTFLLFLAVSCCCIVLVGATILISWLGFFYLPLHLDRFGFYLPVVVGGGSILITYMATTLGTIFDLLGDVAYYVAHENLRSQNIERMSGLINLIAESAPAASVLVVGHSLGSVLVSQALAHLSSGYAGTGRTVLVTMGSPLKLMSSVFPDHIQSPDSLLDIYESSGLQSRWINLWRTKDHIGRALNPAPRKSFIERSLGPGGHAHYWSDERVWATIAQMIRDLASGNLSELARLKETLAPSSHQELV